ncbi:MAG: BMP family ABC transporter substrate-binding protein [Fimbriimonadaceae bacterium]|nr:BMP family ABC transporter substrate-binding protein [Fimbriimonadaceae bacterium]QYK58602.1 MAG: BMP family ABC transporter substrate-binding protein [Fimbriimonadaceae bacterium]
MRHTLLFVVVAVMAALVGCSPQAESGGGAAVNGSAKTQQQTQIGIVFDTGGLGDKSFNDSAWRGMQRAEQEFGFKVLKVESKAESDYPSNLSALADQGCKVVVAVGINMRPALQQVAPQYPDVKFVSIDGEPIEGSPNVRTIQFKEEEGSFLVGYLAGLVTKTGKIGFVGGQELPLIHKFQYGYMAGAKTANPAVTILPAKYTGSWDNQDTAKVAANVLFGEGADIVYHAAGRAGLGVIAAAKEKGLFAIGVDSDQDDIAPGHVLTSMIKRVDEGVYLTLKDFSENKWTPGAVIYDLKADGVGTTDFRNTKEKIGDENVAKLEQVKAKLESGEIKPPTTEKAYGEFLSGAQK